MFLGKDTACVKVSGPEGVQMYGKVKRKLESKELFRICNGGQWVF